MFEYLRNYYFRNSHCNAQQIIYYIFLFDFFFNSISVFFLISSENLLIIPAILQLKTSCKVLLGILEISSRNSLWNAMERRHFLQIPSAFFFYLSASEKYLDNFFGNIFWYFLWESLRQYFFFWELIRLLLWKFHQLFFKFPCELLHRCIWTISLFFLF